MSGRDATPTPEGLKINPFRAKGHHEAEVEICFGNDWIGGALLSSLVVEVVCICRQAGRHATGIGKHP